MTLGANVERWGESRGERMGSKYPLHIEAALALGRIRRDERILVAGGAAYDLLTTRENDMSKLACFKEGGQPRDLDLICEVGVEKRRIARQIQDMVSGKVGVETSLGSNIKMTEKGDWLEHHQVRVPLHPGIFTPVMIRLEGTDIPVLRPQTMVHVLKIMHGKYSREKDRVKADELLRLSNEYPLPFSEREYEAFDEFHERKMEYGVTKWLLSGDLSDHSGAMRELSRRMKQLPGGVILVGGVRNGLLKLEELSVGLLQRLR